MTDPTKTKKYAETVAALLTTTTIFDAAQKLEIPNSTLHKRIERWGLRDVIEKQRQEILEGAKNELINNSTKAALNIVSKIDSEDETISMKASTETLDRVGLGKQQTAPTVNLNFNKIAEKQRDEYGL
jgi:hypothetical protein